MVVGPFNSIGVIIRDLRIPVSLILAYLVIVSLLDYEFHLEIYNFPISIVVILGTVIGLLLAFRTNSSYARWWEARTIWGAIVNDSRTWVRQLLEFSQSDESNPVADPVLQQMSYRQIAWCFALSRSLRGQDQTQDLANFLDKPEIYSCLASQHIPNQILLNQGIELRKLFEANRLELFQFVELEKTLTRLTDSMGGCERIRNTPFPRSYSRMVDGLIYVFVLFLPFGLFNVPPVALIATSISLALTFLVIDRVAIYLQDPFSNRPSDTPMLALSRTIEINIRQMLGESDVPEPMKPVDGILN